MRRQSQHSGRNQNKQLRVLLLRIVVAQRGPQHRHIANSRISIQRGHNGWLENARQGSRLVLSKADGLLQRIVRDYGYRVELLSGETGKIDLQLQSDFVVGNCVPCPPVELVDVLVSFRITEIEFEPLFAIAASGRPSPLKSAVTMESGSVPTVIS